MRSLICDWPRPSFQKMHPNTTPDARLAITFRARRCEQPHHPRMAQIHAPVRCGTDEGTDSAWTSR